MLHPYLQPGAVVNITDISRELAQEYGVTEATIKYVRGFVRFEPSTDPFSSVLHLAQHSQRRRCCSFALRECVVFRRDFDSTLLVA